MGIVLFSAAALFDGLQGVVGWLGGGAQPAAKVSQGAPHVWHKLRVASLRPAVRTGAKGVHGFPAANDAVAGKVAISPSSTLPLNADAVRTRPQAVVAVPRSQAAASCPARVARPLRVVRVLDASAGRAPVAGAGRMVISGRMADVCAELDRLAALESGTASTLSLR